VLVREGVGGRGLDEFVNASTRPDQSKKNLSAYFLHRKRGGGIRDRIWKNGDQDRSKGTQTSRC